jgi:hypothetical protein
MAIDIIIIMAIDIIYIEAVDITIMIANAIIITTIIIIIIIIIFTINKILNIEINFLIVTFFVIHRQIFIIHLYLNINLSYSRFDFILNYYLII